MVCYETRAFDLFHMPCEVKPIIVSKCKQIFRTQNLSMCLLNRMSK
jgi:hypothetical protein